MTTAGLFLSSTRIRAMHSPIGSTARVTNLEPDLPDAKRSFRPLRRPHRDRHARELALRRHGPDFQPDRRKNPLPARRDRRMGAKTHRTEHARIPQLGGQRDRLDLAGILRRPSVVRPAPDARIAAVGQPQATRADRARVDSGALETAVRTAIHLVASVARPGKDAGKAPAADMGRQAPRVGQIVASITHGHCTRIRARRRCTPPRDRDPLPLARLHLPARSGRSPYHGAMRPVQRARRAGQRRRRR
ncbi:hypothetical protein Y602_908 [Burkholderia pseudomallei MSHR733]|nr:hypothetical protein Y602_908 [Burkholderia pseudomallei MSHR733]